MGFRIRCVSGTNMVWGEFLGQGVLLSLSEGDILEPRHGLGSR